MSDPAHDHSNAQFRTDSARGQERAQERLDEQGGAADHPTDRGHAAGAPHGDPAQGRGPAPR